MKVYQGVRFLKNFEGPGHKLLIGSKNVREVQNDTDLLYCHRTSGKARYDDRRGLSTEAN